MAFSHPNPATVQVNQLQFSSNPNGGATVPLGLSYNRFQKPQPIVIQKVGAQAAESHQGHAQAFQFTNVSTDSLNQAMQLAKRDLKQQRLEESLQSATKAKSQSKQCMEKGKKRRARPAGEPKKIVPSRKPPQRSRQEAMPVAPHSPPVRDSDPHRRPMTQDDRTIADIHRLHQQIGTCVRQIQRLQQAAAVDARVRRQTGKVYAEDIEEERKRQMRAEEQTTRSARNIYQLGQQVKDLQHEINGLTIGNIKKKSQAYSRLAATQRAAIRAIQAFVQHMPDFDVARKGMPASYAELGLLIEQLSVCCAQLGVAGLSGVPQSVLNLETSFMSEVGQTSPRSPPRLCQLPKKKSPASRCLEFETQIDRGAVVREAAHQKENKPFRAKQKPLKKSKPKPQVVLKHSSPDRTAALQAGVAALVRASSPTLSPRSPRRPLSPPRSPTVYFVPPLNLPKSPQSPRSRSVLEPRRFEKSRVLIPQSNAQYSGITATSTHFAEPTFSSRAKQIDPHEWPVTESPSAVRRSRSPNRSHSAPSSPAMSPSRYSPRYSAQTRLNQSILRDAWLEKQTQKDSKELYSMRLNERTKLEQWRRKLGSQHKLLTDTEHEIRSKLQPILNKAEEISAKFALLQGYRSSFSSSSSSESESLPHASMNADILGDMRVNELLNETIGEIDEVTADEHAEEIASAMKHAPDVEALMDRLAQMECEQDEVRRRWATIVYQDAETGQPLLMKCTDDVQFGNRRSPGPIEIVPIRTDMKPGFSTLDSKPNYSHSSENAIVFTKPKQTAIASSTLAFSKVDGLLTAQSEVPDALETDKAMRLFLSKDSVLNIQKNKADYAAFLRKTTQAAQGKFKPWQLMEEISEKIFDDCMSDVVLEIDRINSEIVEHVYGAEFAHVPERTGLDSCL